VSEKIDKFYILTYNEDFYSDIYNQILFQRLKEVERKVLYPWNEI